MSSISPVRLPTTISPSNNPTSSIPPELILEILSWLPIKDILRLKSVCKQWYQLITKNPHFAQLQLNRSTKSGNSILILTKIIDIIGKPGFRPIRSYLFCSADVHDLEYPKNILFPFNDNDLKFDNFHHIISSCNGILCFVIIREKNMGGKCIFNIISNSSFFLWNPSTNKHVTIPCPPIPSEHKEHIHKIYYFDPKYGFGFHPVSNEYKLVRILGFRHLQCNSQLSVYTLGGDCWRVLGDIPYVVKSVKLCNTLVNGALHWAAMRFRSNCWDFILSFDIRDECIREIQLPVGVSSQIVENETVSELGGLLCYTFQVKRTKEIHVWVMKEYGVVNSWTEQYMFELPEVENWSRETYIAPLCMVNDEEVLFIKGGTLHIFVYNPRDKSVRKRKGCRVFSYRQFFPHVRSLIWPTVSSDCGETEKGDEAGSSSSDLSSVKADSA